MRHDAALERMVSGCQEPCLRASRAALRLSLTSFSLGLIPHSPEVTHHRLKAFSAFALLSMSGCASMRNSAERLRQRSLQTGVCAVHHVPLQEARYYPYKDSFAADPVQYHASEQDYPNALPLGVASPKNPWLSKAYWYCAMCQLMADERKHQHKP